MTGQPLHAGSRLDLAHLVVRPEGEDEYIVGDAAAGVFFSVPEIAASAVRLLADGHTIGSAEAALARATGFEVDVLDLADQLIAAGVVGAVDGTATGKRREGRWWAVSRAPRRLVRPLFSPVAWCGYAMCFLGGIMLLWAEPGLIPTYEDMFFVPDVLVSIIVTNAMAVVLALQHEVWHALAGASVGVVSRLRLSRRAYLLVLETDLTGIWAIPARQRFGPLLAGMAIDATVMFGCLAIRFGWSRDWWDLPPTLIRLLGTMCLVLFIAMTFQGLAFLRTDLYMVLVAATRTRNLHRIAVLPLKRALRRTVGLTGLSASEERELAAAHPRDWAVARWYRLLYLSGCAWLLWFFTQYGWPTLKLIFGWSMQVLLNAPMASRGWWEAVVVAALAVFDLVSLVAIYFVQRQARSVQGPS